MADTTDATGPDVAPEPDPGPEPVLLYRLFRYTFDDGTEVEVEMTPAMAAGVRRLDDAMKAREKRHAKRTQTFTDAEINGNHLAKGHDSPRAKGYPWEGPRYPVTRLIGEGRIWRVPRLADVAPLVRQRLETLGAGDEWCRIARVGPNAPCEFCGGAWLARGEFCLRCSRSGYDREPDMRVTKVDMARRARDYKPDAKGLKGGKG